MGETPLFVQSENHLYIHILRCGRKEILYETHLDTFRAHSLLFASASILSLTDTRYPQILSRMKVVELRSNGSKGLP